MDGFGWQLALLFPFGGISLACGVGTEGRRAYGCKAAGVAFSVDDVCASSLPIFAAKNDVDI